MAHEGRANLLRPTSREARVEPVELFFDLVFVFAITQLSHRLIAHPDGRGAAETGLLFLAEPYLIAAGVGGPALYLLGLALFKRAGGGGHLPTSHLVGLAALIALAPAGARIEPWQQAIAIATVMVVVAIWETRSLGARHRAEQAAAEGRSKRKKGGGR